MSAFKNFTQMLFARKPAEPETLNPATAGDDLAEPNTSQVQEHATSGAVRKSIQGSAPSRTPDAAIRALKAAQDLSNVPQFVNYALETLRRDPHLQSIVQARVLALTAAQLMCEPAGKKLADRKAAEAALTLLQSEAVEGIVAKLDLSGIYLGFGVAQNFYETSNPSEWVLDEVREVSPWFLTFSKIDARTPLLLPQEQGGALQQLEYGRFIYHAPGIIPGNPLTSSIAYAAVFVSALKAMGESWWAVFQELFGQPIRMGKYPRGIANTPQGKKDLEVLKRAARDLGAAAWAVLPADMEIEFKEASRGSATDGYERYCRYLDEQLAKLVQGGTLASGTGNTGSGGTQALGGVHEGRFDALVRADGKALAVTLRRDVLKPILRANFGPGVAIPRVWFQFEEAQDLKAKVDAACALIDRGLRVPVSELYNLLDMREPTETEEVLQGAPKPAAQAAGSTEAQEGLTALTASRDALDDLLDETFGSDGYAAADAGLDEQLLAVLDGATDFDTLKQALRAVIESGDVADMQAVLTAPQTASATAGALGVAIDDGTA